MEKNPHKGIFIAFEGLDGSGSTTHSSLLSKYLQKKGHKTHETKEPTNNLIGGLIRGQLTGEWSSGQECLQLLFAADRAHHIEREIEPSLKKRHIVITDRYLFSSIAFGSLSLDFDWIKSINNKFILPDLTILLKVTPQTCIKRIGKNRFEFQLFEEINKLKKVWKSYEIIADTFDNVIIIDAERSIEEVSKDIIKAVNKRIKEMSKR